MDDNITYGFTYTAQSGRQITIYPVFMSGDDRLEVASYMVYSSGTHLGNVDVIADGSGQGLDFCNISEQLSPDDLDELIRFLDRYGVETENCSPEHAPCEATFMLADCTNECRVVKGEDDYGVFYNDLLISAIKKDEGAWIRSGGKGLPPEHLEFIRSRIEQLLQD
jgi:hypothetical protein